MIKKLMFILPLIILACNHNIESKIDVLFEEYNGKVPGASLLIIKDGKKIVEKSYGLANLDSNIAVTPQTNFRLASVTKQFTAMCILQLIEKDKLTLETNLKQIFADFPDYGESITIKHLLHHTSGLIDFEKLIPDTATIQVNDKDVLTMMKNQDSTFFKPGSKYKYSNSAYLILAEIIEKISGISFGKYLKENIFKPAGMKNSILFEKGVSIVNNRAMGYAINNGEFLFRDQSLTSGTLGDGGIYSSITDLYKWDQILDSDKLISTKTLNKAFSRGKLNNGELIDYGFGWHLKEFKGKKCVYHTGSTCGFRNVIFRIPEQKFTVIILTNRDEPDLRNLAEKIIDLYLF